MINKRTIMASVILGIISLVLLGGTLMAASAVTDEFAGPSHDLNVHVSESGHTYQQLYGRLTDAKVSGGMLHFSPATSTRHRIMEGSEALQFRAASLSSKVRLHGHQNTGVVISVMGRDVSLYVDNDRLFYLDFQGKPIEIADRDREGIVTIQGMPQGDNRVLVEVLWLGNEAFPDTEIHLGRASLPVDDANNFVEIGAYGNNPFDVIGLLYWIQVNEVQRGRPVK